MPRTCSTYLEKIEARDHSLFHDYLFYERQQEESFCDFEKYNLQKNFDW